MDIETLYLERKVRRQQEQIDVLVEAFKQLVHNPANIVVDEIEAKLRKIHDRPSVPMGPL